MDGAVSICYLHETPSHVFASLRDNVKRHLPSDIIPPRPSRPIALPAVTIADLSTFVAESYPAMLNAWSRATLVAWGAFPAPMASHLDSDT